MEIYTCRKKYHYHVLPNEGVDIPKIIYLNNNTYIYLEIFG